MEKLLEKWEYRRWKPSKGEEYWIVDSLGMADNEIWTNSNSDPHRYDFYNCFQTREEAEQEAEKILITRQLETIATRLNDGRKIDWNNKQQVKYCICLNVVDNEVIWYSKVQYTTQGAVYCLDRNFYKEAIQEIGLERLIKYLRSEA